MALRVLATVLLAVVVTGHASKEKATPIEKVTELLKGLQVKVIAEGKKDAAQYDKYACFCKEQSDEKLYAIEKSTKVIAELTAQISELDADIALMNGDISKLSTKITKLTTDIETDTAKREKSHATYLSRAQDLDEAIEMCGGAITALKESKGSLTDAKVNLVQVKSRLLGTAAKQAMSHDVLGLIERLGQPKFQYQANDIIATLEGLLASMKRMKKELDEAEFDENSVFEKNTLGLSLEKQFATKEKAEKEAIVEAKTAEKNDATEANDEEKKDKAADESFMKVLTAECQDKAKLFDQRSTTRAGELSAMTKAIEALEEGVIPNEGANKKLVGFVQQSGLTPSFIQLVQHNGHNAMKRVEELLQEAAGRLGSTALQSAAVRVMVSKDHFVKVRALINDLIAKLKADAKAEAEQKSFCDKAMSKALTARDTSKGDQEMARAQLSVLNSNKEKLIAGIEELNQKVAENKKALNEASELREEEKADNEETIASAKAGLAATKLALSTLQSFYSTALIQTKYVPPKSDRDGNTVGDLAPEVFDEKYHGAQEESKGIIGILEIIQADFERTITKTKADEKDAQAAFDKFEKENTDDTNTCLSTIKKKEKRLSTTKADILKQEQALKDATEVLDSAKEKLEDLSAMCVEGEETWEERAEKRKAEVEALRSALTILEEWQA